MSQASILQQLLGAPPENPQEAVQQFTQTADAVDPRVLDAFSQLIQGGQLQGAANTSRIGLQNEGEFEALRLLESLLDLQAPPAQSNAQLTRDPQAGQNFIERSTPFGQIGGVLREDEIRREQERRRRQANELRF